MTASQMKKMFVSAAAMMTAMTASAPAFAQLQSQAQSANPTATAASDVQVANALSNRNDITNQNANALSNRNDISNQNANANNVESRNDNTNQNSNANSAQNNNSGNSQNANANSASVTNKNPRWTFGMGFGIYTSPGELFGLDHPVQVMCDPDTLKLVMVTHSSGVITGTRTHIRGPKRDKGYMKDMGMDAKANPKVKYVSCTIEGPKVEAPQVPFLVLVPVPAPVVEEKKQILLPPAPAAAPAQTIRHRKRITPQVQQPCKPKLVTVKMCVSDKLKK